MIWVVIDRLKNFAHFLPIKEMDKMEKLIGTYVKEMVQLHSVPTSIISERENQFM